MVHLCPLLVCQISKRNPQLQINNLVPVHMYMYLMPFNRFVTVQDSIFMLPAIPILLSGSLSGWVGEFIFIGFVPTGLRAIRVNRDVLHVVMYGSIQ